MDTKNLRNNRKKTETYLNRNTKKYTSILKKEESLNKMSQETTNMFERITHFIFRDDVKPIITQISVWISLALFFTLIYFLYFRN